MTFNDIRSHTLYYQNCVFFKHLFKVLMKLDRKHKRYKIREPEKVLQLFHKNQFYNIYDICNDFVTWVLGQYHCFPNQMLDFPRFLPHLNIFDTCRLTKLTKKK